MELPEYVTAEEVKRVCKELNIRDWTALTEPKVLEEEGRLILGKVNLEGINIALDDFCRGLEVELEHGLMFDDANVTNNHPILTGKIVLAHFKESLDYYKRLEVAELEGDLMKAIVRKDSAKIQQLYGELAKAKAILAQAESDQLP